MTKKKSSKALPGFSKSKKIHEKMASKLSSAVSPDEEENDVSVAEFSEIDSKMNKKSSKKRTVLFIPGFRKHKKSHSDKDTQQLGPLIVEDEVLDYVCSPRSLNKGDNCSIDSSSIRSSVSSLEAVLVDNKRTVSIDSGIDCHLSSSMLPNYGLNEKDMSKNLLHQENVKKIAGRAPIASPEDDSLLEEPETETTNVKGDNSENVHNNSSVSFGTLSDCSSCSCDSCDSCSDSDSDTDEVDRRSTSSKQPHSSDSDSDYRRRDSRDGNSYDSDSSDCSDSFEDSKCYFPPSQNSFLNHSRQSSAIVNRSLLNNSVNTSSVKSGKSKKLVKKASKSEKKSSSSSKLGRLASTSSFMKKLTGKFDKSSSKKGNSKKSQQKHNTSKVSLNSSQQLNTSKVSLNGSQQLNSSKVSLNGSYPQWNISKISLNNSQQKLNSSRISLNSSHKCISPKPVKCQQSRQVTSTPLPVTTSLSNLQIKGESAFVTCKSANQNSDVNRSVCESNHVVRRPRISYTDDFNCSTSSISKKSSKDRKNVVSFSENLLQKDELVYKSAEPDYVNVSSNRGNKHLKRSASDVGGVRKPRIKTVPGMRTTNTGSYKNSNTAIRTSCDISELDTSKSLVDVEQAMQKTAFWIENNGYDSNPDEVSTKSLLKQNREVNEKDLCDKIIGIYFSEESDSSLSSSCLDNSGEQDSNSSLSLSDEETLSPDFNDNSTELTVAKFVPEPYQTVKATTRKIKSPEPEESLTEDNKLFELHQKKIELEKLKQQEAILKEKIHSLSRDQNKTLPTIPDPAIIEEKTKESNTHLCCDSRPTSILSEQEIDTITKLHTICNGQRMVRYLNKSESQMIIKHFPPPKSASRIIWDEKLEKLDEVHHTPIKEPVKPRSILCQRPQADNFPYEDDKPSPIVITRIRRSRSGRRSKEWPW